MSEWVWSMSLYILFGSLIHADAIKELVRIMIAVPMTPIIDINISMAIIIITNSLTASECNIILTIGGHRYRRQ
jgi:hypothetical protein